jgi:hypothetical protein
VVRTSIRSRSLYSLPRGARSQKCVRSYTSGEERSVCNTTPKIGVTSPSRHSLSFYLYSCLSWRSCAGSKKRSLRDKPYNTPPPPQIGLAHPLLVSQKPWRPSVCTLISSSCFHFFWVLNRASPSSGTSAQNLNTQHLARHSLRFLSQLLLTLICRNMVTTPEQ